jgi:hypothetical protein
MEKNQVASRVNNAGAGVWCRFVLAVTPRPAGSFWDYPGTSLKTPSTGGLAKLGWTPIKGQNRKPISRSTNTGRRDGRCIDLGMAEDAGYELSRAPSDDYIAVQYTP